MSLSRRDQLLQRTLKPSDFKPNGVYTDPKTYGVYRLTGKAKAGRVFRYGNHPIRYDELVNEYGAAEVVAVFSARSDAEELAAIENALRKS